MHTETLTLYVDPMTRPVPTAYGTYHVVDAVTGTTEIASLERAAEIAQLDEAEILWAVEEHGLCSTDAIVIFEAE